jgi:hypothetical protein
METVPTSVMVFISMSGKTSRMFFPPTLPKSPASSHFHVNDPNALIIARLGRFPGFLVS